MSECNQKSSFDDVDSSFCKIKVEEFVSSTCLPSDIFIKIGQGKFVKIAHENTAIDISRIRQYKDKHVDYFLVRNTDFYKYTGLNLKLAKAVNNVSTIPPEKKLKLYKHTGEVLVQQVFVSGLDEQLCAEAQNVLNNTLNVVSQSDDLLEVLLIMQESDDQLYNHSVCVSIYSCLIAKKRGWTSNPNQYKLSMAALFHDVGCRELPKELLEKPRIKMTKDEVRFRESHAARSRDILGQIRGFPEDLMQIVYQQHENQIGTGFPLGLMASKIHPLAKVLHLADDFVYALFEKKCQTKAEAQDILQDLYKAKGDEYDFESLIALHEALDLPRPIMADRKSLAGTG